MSKVVRVSLLAICAAQLLFAAAFFFQWPPAVALWPFEGTTPLTLILLASFFAAAAASTLWPIVTGHEGALAGVGLDYMVILGPMSVYVLWLGLAGGDSGKIVYAILCAAGALFGLWLFRWAGRLPLDTSIPMPTPVRWSFVVFVAALLFTSVRLFLGIPTIPWPLTPELSIVAGFMFLGAAAYFVYALLRPSWANAGGQLAGFLAYDLVLIVPFLTRLPTIAPEFRTSLIVYITVVVYSGLLAIYYLFVNPTTRMVGAAVREPQLTEP